MHITGFACPTWTRFWRLWPLGHFQEGYENRTQGHFCLLVAEDFHGHPNQLLGEAGRPLAVLICNVQLQPFLLRLEDILPGVSFGLSGL